jgi:ATP-dependent protease ClpP protease subunit
MDNITNGQKRKYDYLDNYNAKYNPDKIKKLLKKSKVSNESEGDEEQDLPFDLPSLFKQDEDTYIYIKDNHLYFHTEVTEESVDKVKRLMRQYYNKINAVSKNHSFVSVIPKPLYLHIFSPGGCAYSGFAIYDFIIEYKKKIPVYTVVEGIAASAATFMSVAGTKRFITPSSYMLIHQLSTFMGGNFEKIKDEFNNSKKMMDKIMEIYEKHTEINKKNIPKILKHDINWDADECLKNGLVEEIRLIDIFNDDNIDNYTDEN